MHASPENDHACLQGLLNDDPRALDAAILRWQRPLYDFAYQYLRNHGDAQDLATETFVRLHQHRGRLRPDTNLPAWLFTTLGNLCCSQYRWRQRHPTVSLEVAGEDGGIDGEALPDPTAGPVQAAEADEAAAVLDAAIGRLPHDYKTAFLLHHFNHLSYAEIGRVLHCSERGIETRIYRAKAQLRAALAGYEREVMPGAPPVQHRETAPVTDPAETP
ncbi:MAG: RNA polymerase sigma factor [Opitutaceae bacterium]|nr:RNA polymerase sigma factor [Opitutaceae bacterium]